MDTGREGILEAMLQELRTINQEIRLLRKDLQQVRPTASPLEVEEAVTTVEQPPPDSAEAAEDAFLSAFDWLASRDITVKNYKRSESADDVFDQLATYLGERFDSLRRLHDQIRRHLGSGSSFTLNLSSRTQEEIANTTQFCTLLHQYTFLSSYRYNKQSRTIHAVPQRVGRVINFFTGGWFERFVFLKVSSLLSQNDLEYVWVINPQISLPNGDDFELDLLFLVENEPLWIECKTGDYSSYIAKYADVRSILDVPEERSILVVLGISDDLSSQLTDLYDLTVANESNVLAQVAAGFDLIEIPRDATPPTPVQPGKLSTRLNKAGLRPLPEIRSEVIDQFIEVVSARDGACTLVDVKSILAGRIQTSKSKLQDVLNAIVRSGCLSDGDGETVRSFTVPFSHLISLNPGELERKCIESYAYAVLTTDPTFFDHKAKVVEFEQVVGGQAPGAGVIAELKRKIRASADTPS